MVTVVMKTNTKHPENIAAPGVWVGEAAHVHTRLHLNARTDLLKLMNY